MAVDESRRTLLSYWWVLPVAGTAGGTVVPCARLGLSALAVGAVGSDEKADWVLDAMRRICRG